MLVLAVAAGCGGGAGTDQGETASATESPSESPSTSPAAGTGAVQIAVGDTLEPDQALIVSASNVDEPTTPMATEFSEGKALDSFVADLDPQLAGDVRAAVESARVPDGSTLYGSVVAVGCDQPDAISVKTTPEGIEATAVLPKTTVQCLVPVTSVALFLLTYE